MDKNKENNEIVEMSHILNQMRDGYSTLAEQRLLYVYLGKINARDIKNVEIKLTLNEFCKICDLKPIKDPKIYEPMTATLMQKLITLPLEDGYVQYTLFCECRLKKDKETEEYYFIFSPNPKCIDLFFNLQQYVKFKLQNALRLKSLNQMRLYTLLKQYQKIGKYKASVNDLRDYFYIKKEEYIRYCDFNDKILKVCQKEINELTDIKFDYIGIRGKGRGGKIIAIEFTIRENSKNKSNDTDVIDYSTDGQLALPMTANTETTGTQIKLRITPEMVEIAKNNPRWAEASEIAKNAENVANLEHYATKIIFNWETKSPNRSPLTSQPSDSSRPQPMSEHNTKSELYVTAPPPKTQEELKCEENEYWSGLTTEEKENFKKQFTDFGLEPPLFTKN